MASWGLYRAADERHAHSERLPETKLGGAAARGTERRGATSRINARGARSRAAILAQATALASVYGLEGVTFGRLAAELGLSKGNIVTLFGSKTRLQIAVLDAAVEELEVKAVAAALQLTSPLERLIALVDRWFALAQQCPYPGGPLLYAACCEYRAQPGPVHDRVAMHRHTWEETYLAALRDGQRLGQLHPDADPAALVFELMALQANAIVAARFGVPIAYELARTCARDRIAGVTTRLGA